MSLKPAPDSNSSRATTVDGIRYALGPLTDLDEALDLYRASTLGERRPIEDRGRMQAMLANANLIISARDGGVLVGIARSVSDFVYCSYLSDLAVHGAYQRRGIGRELLRQTQAAAPQALLVLLAAPKAVEYYPRVGMEAHPSAWVLRPGAQLR